MASATPDPRLPSQPKLVLISPTQKGWPGSVDLGGWLHTTADWGSMYSNAVNRVPPEDGHPSGHRVEQLR